jgi:hypothetical protein
MVQAVIVLDLTTTAIAKDLIFLLEQKLIRIASR